MSTVSLTIVTLLYGAAAIDEAFNGRPHAALMLLGYTVANVGLMWGMR